MHPARGYAAGFSFIILYPSLPSQFHTCCLCSPQVEKGYAPYEKGIEQDVFMRGIDGRPYLGWVRCLRRCCCALCCAAQHCTDPARTAPGTVYTHHLNCAALPRQCSYRPCCSASHPTPNPDLAYPLFWPAPTGLARRMPLPRLLPPHSPGLFCRPAGGAPRPGALVGLSGREPCAAAQRWAGPGSVACSTTLCRAAYVTFPALSALQAPSEEPWLCLHAPLWRALYLVRAVLGSPELPHSPTSWPATLRTFKYLSSSSPAFTCPPSSGPPQGRHLDRHGRD